MTLSPEWILGSIITIMALILGFAFKMIADLGTALDEVKKDYVRRDDLTANLATVERNLAEVKSDVKASASMLVQVLLELGTKPKTRA